jgi:hypothetical protein
MKANFERSTDVQTLVEYLASQERATYAAMSALLKRDIDGQDRHVLVSARRILEARGTVFAVERGIGLVRASNGQKATLSTTHPVNKVRRITRRANKLQPHVNVQALSSDERLAFYVGRTMLNVIGKSTMRSFRNQIAKQIEKQNGEPLTAKQVTALGRLKK